MFFSFDDMPELHYPPTDYAEQDRETEEKFSWLADALPWVAANEMDELRKRDDFPGIHADYGDLAAFVARVEAGRSRIVQCKVEQNGFTLSAGLDLISGQTYLMSNGVYEPSELEGYLSISVDVGGRLTHCLSGEAEQGRIDPLSSYEVKRVVETLAKAKALPPL